MGVRGDLRLLETAVRRRWNIDTERAAQTVNEALTSSDERIRMRAAGIAAVMEGQNQKDEHKVIDVRVTTRHDKLASVAANLGIDLGAIEAAEREAGRDIAGLAIEPYASRAE